MATSELPAARACNWAEEQLTAGPHDEQQQVQLLASLADQLMDSCTCLAAHASQARVRQAATCLMRAVQVVLQEQKQGMGLMHEAVLAACYNLADTLAKAVVAMDPHMEPSRIVGAPLHVIVSALPPTPLAHLLHIVEMCGGITGKHAAHAGNKIQPAASLRQQLQQQKPSTKCIIAACCISSALQQFTDSIEGTSQPDTLQPPRTLPQDASSKARQDQDRNASHPKALMPSKPTSSSSTPAPFISALLAGLLGENMDGDSPSRQQLRACESMPGALDWSSSTTNSLLIPAYCLSVISGHHSISSSGCTSSITACSSGFDSSSGQLQPVTSQALDTCCSNISHGATGHSSYGNGIEAVRGNGTNSRHVFLAPNSPEEWSLGASKQPPSPFAAARHAFGGHAVQGWPNRDGSIDASSQQQDPATREQAGGSGTADLSVSQVADDEQPSGAGHGVGNASELQAFKRMLKKSRPPRYPLPATTAAPTETNTRAAVAIDMNFSQNRPARRAMQDRCHENDVYEAGSGGRYVEGCGTEVEAAGEEDGPLPELTHPSQICGRACCDITPAASYITLQQACSRQARRKKAMKVLSSMVLLGAPTAEEPDAEVDTFTCSMSTPWAISERGSTSSGRQPVSKLPDSSSAPVPSAVVRWLSACAQRPSCLPSLLMISATMQLVALATHVYAVASFGSMRGIQLMLVSNPPQNISYAVIMLAMVSAAAVWLLVPLWQRKQCALTVPGAAVQAVPVISPSQEASGVSTSGQSSHTPAALQAGHTIAKPKLVISLPEECALQMPGKQNEAVIDHPAEPLQRSCPAWATWLLLVCPGASMVALPWLFAWRWSKVKTTNAATPFSISVATSSASGIHTPTSLATSSSPGRSTGAQPQHDVERAQPVTLTMTAAVSQARAVVLLATCNLLMTKVYIHFLLETAPCMIAAAVAVATTPSYDATGLGVARHSLIVVVAVDSIVALCMLVLLVMHWASRQQAVQVDSNRVALQFPDLHAASLQFSDLSKNEHSPRVSPSYEVPSGFIQNM